MINAWGDSFRANEFYDVPRQSVIDNGFEKTREVSDADIISYFTGNVSTEDTMFDALTDFSDERKQEILTNFGKKHEMTKEQSKYYINYALQMDTQNKINKLKECY
jgi:ATP-dependent protease HslVU (ClpYQ) peptidase subunit